ncbi:NAD(P)-dependent oxidoreductase [Tessaracoccus sp. OS52]|uniref:NAD-dependent epimerase/dehydratase family protein n=1 Tax=Tessaracoccus sp. OS52 TaxID=2886691 RepID=UPI001D0F61F3|nr:NAD(P)-dependent oxidoreductase [Tessaracoccus sp. OS52]MCC2593289.1 NAD(P)-dependent oxidoreductase [Tessaracoccus sp. OS52]
MRIALLGGSGRIGGWIAPRLATAHEVTIIDRMGPVVVEATDRQGLAEVLENHDALVHLCARVPRGDEATDPRVVGEAWAVNVGSVAQAMLACADAGVARFLHMSSLSVFAYAGVRRLGADEAPDSLHPYGLSKRMAEATAAELAPVLGIAAVSIRIGWPTPDATAPLWLNPSTGQPEQVRLADGSAVPAIAGSDVARWIATELAGHREPGHRILNLVADESAVFAR